MWENKMNKKRVLNVHRFVVRLFCVLLFFSISSFFSLAAAPEQYTPDDNENTDNQMNIPPVAIVEADPTEAYVYEMITFDGSGSYDPGASESGSPEYSPSHHENPGVSPSPDEEPTGTIVSYQWDFGDQSDLSMTDDPVITYSYKEAGIYTAILTVFDDEGASDDADIKITILEESIPNKPPLANAGGPYFAWKDEMITLDGSGSSDTDGDIITYHWTFHDDTEAFGAFVDKSFSEEGIFSVTLGVTDNDEGYCEDETTIHVCVLNTAPIANHDGPYFGWISKPISFSALESFDSDGEIVSYHWDFGDGSTGVDAETLHIYENEGTFTIILTVEDNEGRTNTAETYAIIVALYNAPTTPEVTIPTHSGGEYTFSMMSSDPDGDSICYHIDFGDGSEKTTPYFSSDVMVSTSHRWKEAGTYVISIYAEDTTGEVSESVTLQVDISEQVGSEVGASSKEGFWSLEIPLELLVIIIGLLVSCALIFIAIKKRRKPKNEYLTDSEILYHIK